MNKCDACKCEIGYVYSLTGLHSCGICGTGIELIGPQRHSQYRGMVGSIHKFRLLHSVLCPECFTRLFDVSIPCGEDDYDEEFTQEVYKLFGIPAESYS